MHIRPISLLSTVIILTAGTLFVMWLGEKITGQRIGQWYFHHYHDRYSWSFPTSYYTGVYMQNNKRWRWFTDIPD